MHRLITLIIFFTALGIADTKKLESQQELYLHLKKAFKNPVDKPDLPRVLLIGDSISIGYTVPVRILLQDKANVHRIPTNGRYSAYGLKNLPKWLGDKPWDVIHFNWGLWDLCYRHPDSKTQGNRDKVNGKITASLEEFGKNLEAIVIELKKTKAKLVWCAITPVPEHEAGRIKGDELKYNQVAAEIMKKHGVVINDLHSHALKKLPAIAIRKGDVHFTKDGSKFLAEKVASAILQQLK